jgi:hypothetical protein
MAIIRSAWKKPPAPDIATPSAPVAKNEVFLLFLASFYTQ